MYPGCYLIEKRVRMKEHKELNDQNKKSEKNYMIKTTLFY
jgi:hypothetical protein